MNEQAQGTVADREVSITRLFDAPRETVFKAWTDPDQVAQWWGPEGFDAPRDKITIEPRVGGRFDITMVVRNREMAAGMGVEVGTEFPDHSTITELVEGKLIVSESEPQPEIGLPVKTVNRVEFHDEGDGTTRVEIRSGPYTSDMAPNAEMGWKGQLDKLDQLLAA